MDPPQLRSMPAFPINRNSEAKRGGRSVDAVPVTKSNGEVSIKTLQFSVHLHFEMTFKSTMQFMIRRGGSDDRPAASTKLWWLAIRIVKEKNVNLGMKSCGLTQNANAIFNSLSSSEVSFFCTLNSKFHCPMHVCAQSHNTKKSSEIFFVLYQK